jgi:transmembrane 9 superfamily protein 2/4
VPLLVNSLTPASNLKDGGGLSSVISYDYYFKSFNFCKPKDGPKKQSESLGSILFGDRIFDSPFELYMLKNETCKKLCTASYNARDATFVQRRMWQDYMHNWLIDGLPAAREATDADTNQKFYSAGFPLGSADLSEGEFGLNNHYNIKVEYHTTRTGKYRVVGVIVDAISSNNKPDDNGNVKCGSNERVILDTHKDDQEVTYTYSVSWVESPTPWATRWDKYLHVYDPKIHWFSLVNSVIIVMFLTAMVATILLRALRKDIARYNEIDLTEDVQEDSGWKLIHGDVFRSPKNHMLLSVLLGSGTQLFVMTGFTLLFALLGFLSPSNRGSLTTVMILLYTLFGFVGGFVSAKFYKTFGGESWKLNMLLTPLVVPGFIFTAFFALNFFLIFAKSSGAVPLGTMIALVAIWFAISAPLSAAGSFLGFKKAGFSFPVRTNQIPRQIPPQPTYLKPVPSMLIAGILPFGAIFVELYFILNSIWFHKLYYMFGFLFLCYGLMIVTSAAVTILMTYFMLTSENYHWQWRSFFLSGSAAVYIFLHAVIYWAGKLSLGGFISNVLYLGYSLLISIVIFILTGTIGFLSSFFFVKKIYSSIKID